LNAIRKWLTLVSFLRI